MADINPDTVREVSTSLTDLEKTAVLFEIGTERGIGPAHLVATLHVSTGTARAILKSLRQKGVVDFGPLACDDGFLRGRGYWLDRFGIAVRDHLQEVDLGKA